MECSALFILAQYFNINSGAILVVDGNVSEKKIKEKKDKPETFQQTLLGAIEIALKSLSSL